MIPMLLMVNQPFLITWETHRRIIMTTWPLKNTTFFTVTHSFIYATAQENILWLGLEKQHRGIPLVLFRSSSVRLHSSHYTHIPYTELVLFTLNRSLTPLSGWMRIWRERYKAVPWRGKTQDGQVTAHGSWPQGGQRKGGGFYAGWQQKEVMVLQPEWPSWRPCKSLEIFWCHTD